MSDPSIASTEIIKPARFHHMVYKTRDHEVMKAWYANLVGSSDVANLAFTPEGPFASFTSYDEANHRVAFFGFSGYGDRAPGQVGLHHIAFEYDELDDLLHNYVRLRDQGITPVWSTDHGPTISFYYRDPDANLVELQIDNFPDEPGRSKQFMMEDEQYNTPGYTGEDVDPELLVAERAAGVSPAEIHVKGWAGGYRPATPVGPPTV